MTSPIDICPPPTTLTGVSPAYLRGPVVDGEAVGQTQAVGDDDPPVAAVHAGTGDLRRLPVPVGPEDKAGMVKEMVKDPFT